MTPLHCPTDGVSVNENQVRLTAGFVLLTTLAYLFSGWLLFPLVLLADFSLRAFNFGRFSPFFRLSGWLVNRLNIGFIATDRAPKRFAARIGLVFALALVAFTLNQSWLLAWPVGAVLAIFAFLESVLGFCAGCWLFPYWAWVFRPRSSGRVEDLAK